jgi:hypothetical protein
MLLELIRRLQTEKLETKTVAVKIGVCAILLPRVEPNNHHRAFGANSRNNLLLRLLSSREPNERAVKVHASTLASPARNRFGFSEKLITCQSLWRY